ncbi:MAG: ribose-phosphate diphosphokinase [Actinobacteria bacterium]|nr:ribose-phosphate diphosphokinase [Actinomycetota bacterium]
MIFSGSAHRGLAEEVATHLGMRLGEVEISRFASSEAYIRFQESVRGSDALVIQSHCDPVDSNVMEQLLMIDALKRASAKRITAVAPFYAYSRQDRKARSREPVAAKLLADFYEAAGADRILSVDLHSGQIQGFFDVPFDHLTALPLLGDHFAEILHGEDFVIVSPDAGGDRLTDKWAEYLAGFHHLQGDVAFIHKRRNHKERNKSQSIAVVGDVTNKTCVIVDDMIDTAGTLVNGAEALIAAGASEIYAAATHAVLSGPAVDRIKNSPIKLVVVTNTLPVPSEKQLDNLIVLSIAPIIAQAVKAVFEEESVSELFHGENQP